MFVESVCVGDVMISVLMAVVVRSMVETGSVRGSCAFWDTSSRVASWEFSGVASDSVNE